MTENLKKKLWKSVDGQRLMVFGVILVLFVFFSVKSAAFRQYSTILSMLDYSYYVTFMAIGVTFALITGGNDLSIGTGMVCYSLIGGYMVTRWNLPVGVGILVTLLCGALMGAFNGYLIAVLEIPAFIATLCTMMFARGIGSIFTEGVSVAWPQAGSSKGWFRSIFKLSIGNTKIPLGFLWVILLVILMSLFLRKTRPGRYMLAIGSNKEAARLSGINVIKWQMLAYVICGIFTGLAGVAYAAKFQTVAAGTGAGLELEAICAAIIGGTSMHGGTGTITGTLLGVFVMSLLNTGLTYIHLQSNWQQIITGVVLIVAVLIDVIRARRR